VPAVDPDRLAAFADPEIPGVGRELDGKLAALLEALGVPAPGLG
jgi:hypothetical protein